MGIRPTVQGMAVPFFAAISTYLLNHLITPPEQRLTNPRREKVFAKWPVFFWFTGIGSMALGFYFSWQLGTAATLLYGAVVIFGSTYAMTLSPLKRLVSIGALKDIPASKELFVALAWGIITAHIPYLSFPNAGGIEYTFLFAFGVAFLRTAILGSRYIQEDEIVGKETIHTALGKRNATIIIYGIVFILASTILTGYLSGAIGRAALGLLAGNLYLLGFIIYSMSRKWGSIRSFEFFFDAQFILTGLLVFLLK